MVHSGHERAWLKEARAFADLSSGFRCWELWGTLGWHDIRQRYRRSVVGPFWLTLSMGAMVAGLAYLYAGLFGQSIHDYLPYVAVGMIVFNLMTTIATEGSQVFIVSSRTILQTRAPLSIYVYQMVWRNILIFLHNMVIYILLLIFFPDLLGVEILLAIPALILVVTLFFFGSLVVAALSARFRDVPPIVTSVMQIAFFLTPVFWKAESLRGREIFVSLNPFYYLLEIVRLPLLGQVPSLSTWAAVILMNCVAAIIAFLFFARVRARIAYWV